MTKLQLEINQVVQIDEKLAHSGTKKRVVLLFSETYGSDEETFHIDYEVLSENIDLELMLLVLGKPDCHYNFDVNVRHLFASSKSKVMVRAVLSAGSSLNCRGKLFVGGKASATDTFLQCDVLMLADTAKVKAIPSLEIIANEVQASHKASIGGFDEDTLFYFESRGFNREQASKILTDAFLMSSIRKISDLSSQDYDLLTEEVSELFKIS